MEVWKMDVKLLRAAFDTSAQELNTILDAPPETPPTPLELIRVKLLQLEDKFTRLDDVQTQILTETVEEQERGEEFAAAEKRRDTLTSIRYRVGALEMPILELPPASSADSTSEAGGFKRQFKLTKLDLKKYGGEE